MFRRLCGHVDWQHCEDEGLLEILPSLSFLPSFTLLVCIGGTEVRLDLDPSTMRKRFLVSWKPFSATDYHLTCTNPSSVRIDLEKASCFAPST